MKKVFAFAVVCFVAGFNLVACSGPDNVGACKDYIAKVNGLSCIGSAKVADTFCDTYDTDAYADCDITEYFTCLGDAYKCNGDTLDTSGVADCSSKATCT